MRVAEHAPVQDAPGARPASFAAEPGAAAEHGAAVAPEHCGNIGELLHRGQALAVLEECGVRLKVGLPVVVTIEGDRGSGKSALLGALAAGCGAAVELRARCHGAEHGFSFGVVGQLLDRLPAGDLGAPAGAAAMPETREYDLFDRFYRVVRAVAVRGPVVLAIDDLHLADPQSVRWCSYVARRLDDLPAALLVTVSPGGSPAGAEEPAAAELIADLGALAHSRIVRAGPLCTQCTGALISRKLGRPVDPAFARQCHALTRGNPQVLGVAAAQLAAATDTRPGVALEVAARALATTALAWLRQDDPVKARVAVQFAACGGGTLETAAMLVGQGEDVAGAARVALHRIGLLEPGAPDRFAHLAMGEVINNMMPPEDRAAMHAHAARTLSQLGESAILAAEHAMLAGTIGELWTRQVLRQASRQAAAAGDWPRGALYLSRALLEPGPPRQTLAITAELGAMEFHDDVGACLRQAAAAADLAAANPDSAAALAVFADAALAAEDGDAAAVFCHAAAAVAAAKIPERDALLRLAAAAQLSGHTLLPEQSAGIRQAVRMVAGEPGDISARQLLSALALSTAARGRGRDRCKVLALRSAAGGPVTFIDPVPSTAACAAFALAWAGELDLASDTCAQAVEAAHRMASRTGEALALLVRSEIAFQRGSLTPALADARQALQLFQAVGATSLQAAAAAAMTRLGLMRGEPDAIAAQASIQAPRASGHPLILAMALEARGMSAAGQGNHALALRLYLESGRHLMAAGLVNPACSAWRSRAVTVLAGLGRVWEARTLGNSEITLARSWGAPGPLGRALVAAAGAHDGPARRELLKEAVTVLEDSGCQLHLARALIRLGCDLHLDPAGSSQIARDVLERGLDLAGACGAVPLVATAHRAMHAAGARPRGQRGPRGYFVPTILTAAEHRVAALVVTGMSNQAVAVSLTLSKRTIDTHLGRIYRKLGITGRTRLSEAISGADVRALAAGQVTTCELPLPIPDDSA
jgi:DNA-binding CsgD family transcriptional regulator/tetratricopeptide (TPR) repeat protein